jgi:hypothetical protein
VVEVAEHYESMLFVVMMLAVGGWSTAVGYGYWLPPIKDMGEADAWMARHGRKLRMLGPLMLVIAVVYAVLKFFVPIDV